MLIFLTFVARLLKQGKFTHILPCLAQFESYFAFTGLRKSILPKSGRTWMQSKPSCVVSRHRGALC